MTKKASNSGVAWSNSKPTNDRADASKCSPDLQLLCRKDRLFEQRSKNLTAFRLPLRHEVGDLSCLGSNERNPRSGGPRGPSKRERASHWARGEVVLRVQGAKLRAWFLQSNLQSAVSRIYNLRRVNTAAVRNKETPAKCNSGDIAD